MRDISARELKGHDIFAVERFLDNTRWMIEFSVLRPSTAYGSPGEEMWELLTAKANVDRVLKMEVEQDVEKEKDHGQR